MVETITPGVHGGSRRRWGASVAAHTLGAGLSAAAFGGALGWIGSALGAPWGTAGLVVVISVTLLYAARELLGLPVPVPERRRQVPESWRWRYPPNVASFLYGLGLGVGFLTHVRHGTLIAVGVAAAATGNPLIGAMVMAPFGIARGVSLVVTANARTVEGLSAVAERLDRFAASGSLRAANGVALLLLASAAGAAGAAEAGVDLRPALAAAVALVFGWAAASKFVAPRRWRESLGAYRLGPLERPALVGVPLAEGAVVVLILAGASAYGAILALALLLGFSAAIVRARAVHGSLVPCGCFGRTRARDYRVLLGRNVGPAILAAGVLVTRASFPLLQWARLPTGDEVVPVLLAAAGVGFAVWLARIASAALRRQPG
jgi:hypothetical protein